VSVIDSSSSGRRSRRHRRVVSLIAVRLQIGALVSFVKSVPVGNGMSTWSPGKAFTTADRRMKPNSGI
jgi:hypothetical protein